MTENASNLDAAQAFEKARISAEQLRVDLIEAIKTSDSDLLLSDATLHMINAVCKVRAQLEAIGESLKARPFQAGVR